MVAILKRLILGVLLIVGAGALLLFSDLGSRRKPAAARERPATKPVASTPARHVRIAVLQQASQVVLEDGRNGMLDGLADRGWVRGQNLDVKLYNAEGDMPVAQAIAKEMTTGGYDLLLTVSTPSMQAVANANRTTHIPHVFGLVTDPYGAGIGVSRENHLDHPAWLAGYGTMQPVALSFQTAREMNPALATVGVVWNAAESNSEAQVKLAREVCARLGLKLLEATIDNTAGVGEAAGALAARGVDALWAPGDVTVISGIDALIAAARKSRIPVFTVIPPNIRRGALFDVGANYHEVGRVTGQLAGDILNGRSPASVPIDNVMPELLTLNEQALAGLKGKWTIPAAMLARAQIVIDENGAEHTKAASTAAAPAARRMRVALLQHASQAIIDQGRDGVIAGLADRGWVDGRTMDLKLYNAGGDMPVGQTIAKEMVSGGYDLLLTLTTPSTQAVAQANQAGGTRHVFGIVADPYSAGIGVSREHPLQHPPYLAGYATEPPVALAFQTAREMNPALATVGVAWNPAEANAEAQLKMARAVCARLGLKLMEAAVDNSSGVGEAAAALVARGADALWVPGDGTVMTAVDTVIAAAKKGRIPVFTVMPPTAKQGSLFDLGADFPAVGRLTGQLAGDILNGRDPATVSIDNVMPELLTINQQALAGLKAKWTIPAALLARAQLVIDENGVAHAQPAAAPVGGTTLSSRNTAAPAPALPKPEPGRTYRIAFAYFAPDASLDSCQRGLLDGLKELGFVEGRNLVVQRSHAQGEMMNISQMIQNLDHTEADVLVPFSTPVLQGALAMAKLKPIVFTYVTDPIAAGAGKTLEDHRPNVTGVGSLPPIEDTIKIIRRVLPQVKTIGTIYNSGEANSLKILSLLRDSVQRHGLALVELTAANSNEVVQDAQALVTRHVDAIYVPGDNTAYLAFDGIIKVANGANIPVINDDPDYFEHGPLLSCGPGFYYSGKAAAPILARVLTGENPATVPMQNVSVNVTKFNRAVAAKLGLDVPPALIAEVERGAGSNDGAATPPSRTPASVAPVNPNPSGKKWNIAVILYSESPPAEETLAGFNEAWKRSPLVAGRDYEIKLRSAQGDMSVLNGLIDAAITDGADLIVPVSTPTLQAAAQRVKTMPVVFSMVANPMAAGAGKSYTDHLPNVTGISVLAPFEEALDLVQKHFPAYRRLGTIYCPAEANSVDLEERLAAACRRRGLTLETVAANTSSDLPDAALALVSRPIDAVLQISDNLTSAGFTAITRAARQAQKPLLSLNSTTVRLGAAVSFGRDYHDSGEATTKLIERVIAGEDPGRIPFTLPPKIILAVSPENAAAVGMTLPPALLREAEAAKKTAAAPAAPAAKPAPPSTSAAAPAPPAKKWKIALVLYNETPPAEETLAGMKDAWKRSSFVEGRDYEIKVRSAQGDMGLLSGIFDAVHTDGADLVVTLSTPTLQMAVKKVKDIPVVFTLVTNPMAAGAGRSYTNHVANVTGIAVLAPMAEALDMIKRHFPAYHRLGTLYCPAEANAVYLKEALDEACRQRGFELETVAANTSADLSDAALALVSRPIDAVLQIPDALSSAGFSALTRAARQQQKPLLALNSTVVPLGAAVALGRDFHNAGEATVAVIERIFRGEDPADIPIALPPKVVYSASPANAAAVGMTLPAALLDEAVVVK